MQEMVEKINVLVEKEFSSRKSQYAHTNHKGLSQATQKHVIYEIVHFASNCSTV